MQSISEDDQAFQPVLEIVDASGEDKDAFGEWLNPGNENARIVSDFSTDNLVRITDNEYCRWAVPSNRDPNTSLSFAFDPVKNIDKAFISNSVQNPDKSITSKIYNLENHLMMEIVHRPDGAVSVIKKGTPGTLGFWERWDEFEYCFDELMNPFESAVANVAIGLVFQAATYNLWIPSVALVCSGVALGRYYQNKDKS